MPINVLPCKAKELLAVRLRTSLDHMASNRLNALRNIVGFHFAVNVLPCFSNVAFSLVLLWGIGISIGSVNGEIITDLAPVPLQKFFSTVTMEYLRNSYIMVKAL